MIDNLWEEKSVMKNVKSVQLAILTEFDTICKENNIKYSLAYGTALGAIRHKGYIPWDDDIDVMMLRSEYIKLSHIWYEQSKNKYFFQTYMSDKNYPYPFAKIRDSNTTFIEENVKGLNMNHGIFIDVFTYDSIADNVFKRTLQLISAEIIWVILKKDGQGTIKNMIFRSIDTLIPYKLKNRICMGLESAIYRLGMGKSSNVANLGYGYKLVERKIPKVGCQSTKVVKFEKNEFNVFKGIEDHLISNYGDYMKLPPVEERVSGHGYHELDHTKSYKEYKKYEH